MKYTVISGIFLLLSLGCLVLKYQPLVDPAWVSVFISGTPLVYHALHNLFVRKRITSPLLISMAMIASVLIGEEFAAGEIAFIMAIGEILEEMSARRAQKGLQQLIALKPTQGRRIITQDGHTQEEQVPAAAIKPEDILRVLPGETIPVDGVITDGTAAVDQSIITGESLPVDKKAGDAVFGGTLNASGSIDIRATQTGKDSTLEKMIQLVREAEEKQAPIERIADKWAGWLVPASLGIAVLTYIVLMFLQLGNEVALERAVTILVVFCPCALALATPTSITAAIGQATQNGVIIKSGEALEKMGTVQAILFDKTGTLTYGKPTVSDVCRFGSYTRADVLGWCASVEQKSEHPLGRAVLQAAQREQVPLHEVADFTMEAGKGISARIHGQQVCCGTEPYLREQGITVPDAHRAAVQTLQESGKALIFVSVENTCAGVIGLSDTLRPEAKAVINSLQALQLKAVLLTGDHAPSARHLAAQTGIDEVYADLLPQHKVEHVRALEASGCHTAMIGDGVNDAPALKTAQVGIAMGAAGSAIAVDAADIALTSDDMSKLPYLVKLSRLTRRSIQLNITLAMGINFLAIILSIAGFLTPVTGALVHNAGSVLVVLNAALLYDRKIN